MLETNYFDQFLFLSFLTAIALFKLNMAQAKKDKVLIPIKKNEQENKKK